MKHPEELSALEERYRQHLIRSFETLEVRGLLRSPRPVELPLEQVYVEPRAVADVPAAADAHGVEERFLMRELEDLGMDRENIREHLLELDAMRRDRWSCSSLLERRSIAEGLHGSEERAVVLLGDPGSGKTTLLRHLALVCARGARTAAERLGVAEAEADRLPIFAPLAAFDDLRGRRPALTVRELLPLYYETRHGLPGLAALFERALASGRALVILDGLDEVIDVETRCVVAEQVSALIDEGAPRGVAFALSSRVVGYREAPLSATVSTLTVLDFGEREIETFVRQWSRAFEVWAADGETPEALERAQALEKGLMDDLRNDASVRRLAANPLMLTMLALLRRQTGKPLAHRRIELYESYVETMLETWIYARSLDAREEPLERLDRLRAESLLIPLALWLQEAKPSGTAGRAEIHRQLTEICLGEEGLARQGAKRTKLREAEARATRFLREMSGLSGLIVERGQDAYGFMHLTFQEYFAGRALAAKTAEERWKIVRDRLHDPRWREPLMLCAGRLGVVENRSQEVTSLVSSILDRDDPTEPDLHRNLLLGLAIANDDVPLDPRLLERLVAHAAGCLPTRVYALAQAVMGHLAQLVAKDAASGERCFDAVWRCDDWHLRKYAVDALARFVPEPSSKDASRPSVRPGSEKSVRDSAVRALSSQVEGHELNRIALLEKLGDDDYQVRKSAVEALSSQMGSDEAIRDAVLEALEHFSDFPRSTRDALSSLVKSDKVVRRFLLERLDQGSDDVRRSVAMVLSSHVESDEAIRNAFRKRLHDRDEYVRLGAVRALSSQVEGDEAIRDALVESLDDDSEHVCKQAVIALSSQVGSAEAVRIALLEKIDHPHEDVREASLVSLAPLLPTDSRVLGAFQRLQRDDSWQVRKAVAEVLGANCTDEEHIKMIQGVMLEATVSSEAWRIVASLYTALPESSYADLGIIDHARRHLESPCWQVRQSAVSVLASRVDSDATVRAALVEKLDDIDEHVSCAAVSALSPLVGSDETVRDALIRSLDDYRSGVGRCAAEALSSQVGSDDTVRNALLESLDHIGLSFSAARALSSWVGSDESLRDTLLEKLDDGKGWNRCSAVRALASQVGSDESIRKALLEKLDDGHHSVRQLAVDALASQVGIDEGIRNAIFDKLDDARVDVRKSSIKALSSQVGSDQAIRNALLERLDDASVQGSAAKALSSQVGSDEALRKTLLEKLDHDDRYIRWCAVDALSSQVGSDEAVRNALLERLDDPDFFVRESAASVLSSQVGSDEAIRNAVLDTLSHDSFEIRLKVAAELFARFDAADFERELGPYLWPWISVDDDDEWAGVKEERVFQLQKRIAERLGKRLPQDPGLRDQMLALLSEIRGSARLGAVLTLLAWPGGPPPEILDRIRPVVDDRRGLESYPSRLAAASFLLNRNECFVDAIEVCLGALDYGTRPWECVPDSPGIRGDAARILAELEPLRYDPRVYEKLLQVMREDESRYVRDATYHALVRLARARDDVRTQRDTR